MYSGFVFNYGDKMPILIWNLRNKKYCDGCPCNYIEHIHEIVSYHTCSIEYYIRIKTDFNKKKNRPMKCIKEKGL